MDPGSELFCHEVKGTPIRISPEKWALSFPFDPGSQEREQDFGIVDPSEYEADSNLDSRTCRSPRFFELTAQRHRASRFFQRIHGRVFTGQLKITMRPRATYQVDVHSNGTVPEPIPANSSSITSECRAGGTPIATPDREDWQTTRGEGRTPEDLPENRIIAYAETHPVWRYNPCFRSVTIVNDFCPWGSNYDRESKDLYFSGNASERSTYARAETESLGTGESDRGVV